MDWYIGWIFGKIYFEICYRQVEIKKKLMDTYIEYVGHIWLTFGAPGFHITQRIKIDPEREKVMQFFNKVKEISEKAINKAKELNEKYEAECLELEKKLTGGSTIDEKWINPKLDKLGLEPIKKEDKIALAVITGCAVATVCTGVPVLGIASSSGASVLTGTGMFVAGTGALAYSKRIKQDTNVVDTTSPDGTITNENRSAVLKSLLVKEGR